MDLNFLLSCAGSFCAGFASSYLVMRIKRSYDIKDSRQLNLDKKFEEISAKLYPKIVNQIRSIESGYYTRLSVKESEVNLLKRYNPANTSAIDSIWERYKLIENKAFLDGGVYNNRHFNEQAEWLKITQELLSICK